MNERMVALLEQSGISVYADSEVTVTRESFQRFAELIVKECANLCRQQSMVGWNDDRRMQAKLDAEIIKEHFGVE